MVVLVDKDDNPIGQISKMEAHQRGHLHRAFSIIIYNEAGELLMQQRALNKYHSAGLWSNTCCSHPFPSENILDAAYRRLWEEMGLYTELKYLFKFQYCASFDNGLVEHEIDSVFIGYSDEISDTNPNEVHGFRYMSLQSIKEDLARSPYNYTVWFKMIFDRLLKEFDTHELDEILNVPLNKPGTW
jgi:isopentenyl-diphosphate Delta-isomerase